MDLGTAQVINLGGVLRNRYSAYTSDRPAAYNPARLDIHINSVDPDRQFAAVANEDRYCP
jgi:hypothetical protein